MCRSCGEACLFNRSFMNASVRGCARAAAASSSNNSVNVVRDMP
ncbi:hypothetical protein [Chitinophaga lutea]